MRKLNVLLFALAAYLAACAPATVVDQACQMPAGMPQFEVDHNPCGMDQIRPDALLEPGDWGRSVTEFGATCAAASDPLASESVDDDAPAINLALADADAHGGGTLLIPADCKIRIKSPVSISIYGGRSLTLRGAETDTSSEIEIDLPPNQVAIRLVQGSSSVGRLTIQDLLFTQPRVNGQQINCAPAARHVFLIQGPYQPVMTIRNVTFAGLTTSSDIIRFEGGNADLYAANFFGVMAGKGYTLHGGTVPDTASSNVHFYHNWMFRADNLIAHDYGLVKGTVYSACGASRAGIEATPIPPNGTYPQPRTNGLVAFSQFDEGWGDQQIYLGDLRNPNGMTTHAYPRHPFGIFKATQVESNSPGYGGANVLRTLDVDALSVEMVGVRWCNTATKPVMTLNGVRQGVLEYVRVNDQGPCSKLLVGDPLYPWLPVTQNLRVIGSNFTEILGRDAGNVTVLP